MTTSRAVTFALAMTLVVATAPRALAGTDTGFAFLNLPAGARASAMGGAGVVIAEGPTALYWNPAGIAPAAPVTGSAVRVEADHNESILTFRQDIVGGAYQRGGDALALAVNAHYTESIEQRDELGNLLGSFGADDIAISAGYAATASPGFRLGGSLAWVQERLGGTSASTLSFSAGALYALSESGGITLGASVRNLGGSPSFQTEDGGEGESVSQPTTFAAGASWAASLGDLPLLLAGDVSKLKGDSGEARLGAEARVIPSLALRAGWMFGQDEADITAGAGLSLGKVDVDYAFVPYHDDLGSSHKIAIGARL